MSFGAILGLDTDLEAREDAIRGLDVAEIAPSEVRLGVALVRSSVEETGVLVDSKYCLRASANSAERFKLDDWYERGLGIGSLLSLAVILNGPRRFVLSEVDGDFSRDVMLGLVREVDILLAAEAAGAVSAAAALGAPCA